MNTDKKVSIQGSASSGLVATPGRRLHRSGSDRPETESTSRLRVMMPVHMADYSIGLDLGGTNLRAAAIDRSGKMLDKISGATNFVDGRDAVLNDIVAAI